VGKSCPVANSPASVLRVQRPAMSTRNLTREPVLQKSCAALHFHTPTLLYTRYSRQHLEVGFTRFTIWSLTARSKKSYKRQCPRPIKKKPAKKSMPRCTFDERNARCTSNLSLCTAPHEPIGQRTAQREMECGGSACAMQSTILVRLPCPTCVAKKTCL